MKLDWKTCAKIGVSAFLLYLCITYWPHFTGLLSALLSAATPLLLGCALAYVLNILMSFYEKHYFTHSVSPAVRKSRRPVCMLAAFITLAAGLILILNLVLPELLSCVNLLLRQIPTAANSLANWLGTMDAVPEDLLASLRNVDWASKLEQIISFLTTGVGNIIGTAVSAVSSVFSGLVTALFALIFSIYLLLGKERLGSQFNRIMKRYMSTGLCANVRHVLSVLNECFHKYIVGQCTEALILGGLCTLGMLILQLPYATMTGAVIAFTALIPVAGAYIGAGVGAFMILTVSPVKAIIFLVFIVILQQLEGNLIYPRVVGSSMGLPGIWVLAAVTVGGGVMGIPGMLLYVPLAAAFYKLLREDVNRIPSKEEAVI